MSYKGRCRASVHGCLVVHQSSAQESEYNSLISMAAAPESSSPWVTSQPWASGYPGITTQAEQRRTRRSPRHHAVSGGAVPWPPDAVHSPREPGAPVSPLPCSSLDHHRCVSRMPLCAQDARFSNGVTIRMLRSAVDRGFDVSASGTRTTHRLEVRLRVKMEKLT